MAFRLDRAGSVSRFDETPQGGLRLDATLTRAGVFTYVFNGQTIREYRPLEEVSRADSLATLRDAPVTDRHPPGAVNSKNYKAYNAGHLSGEPRMDGSLVAGSVVVQEDRLLQAIKAKRQVEVSCGYSCRIDEVSGVSPDGEAYDRIQRDITYNHVSIVELGRAGREVALRLDAEGNSMVETDPTPEEKLAAVTEQISNLKQQLTEQLEWQRKNQVDTTARIAELEALKASLEGKLKDASARADAAEGKLVAAEASIKELTARADAAEKPEVLEAAVSARLALVDSARSVLGREFKADGLDELGIKSAVVAKAFPAVDLKDKGLAFVNPVFEAAVSKPAPRNDAADKLRSAARPAGNPQNERKDEALDANKSAEKLRQDSQEAWKAPLALSK